MRGGGALLPGARRATSASSPCNSPWPTQAIPTHIVGTANPRRILQNIREIEEPIDESLLAAVQAILAPVHNVTWPSGRPENN